MAAVFGKVQQAMDSLTYLAELMGEREMLSGHAARLVDQERKVTSYCQHRGLDARTGIFLLSVSAGGTPSYVAPPITA
ncbi:hypothetical protein MRX96_015643 [Rhipicephalus microplus]